MNERVSEYTPQTGGSTTWTGIGRGEKGHMRDLCGPAQKTKATANVWGNGEEGGTTSPLSLNPINPGREMLIT